METIQELSSCVFPLRSVGFIVRYRKGDELFLMEDQEEDGDRDLL